ncbi:MAG: peptidase [Rhodospirillaceae bacterium]|nr:peptidase [Rhodospirillaceae bacterium]
MILGFRHKGLERLFEKGDRRRVSPRIIARVERVLARLDVAADPGDMNLPGFGLHPAKGDLAGYWTVSVSGNWRVVFRFDGRDVTDVDLVDYH